MQNVKNKYGYTLTYAIVVIALLLILTSSVVLLTYMNLKFSKKGGQINTSFYASDGAMEEAITELNRYIYNAEQNAWKSIQSETYLTKQEWVVFLDALYNDIDDGILTLDEGNRLIANAIRGEFETAFFQAICQSTAPKSVLHAFFDAEGSGLGKYLDYGGYNGLNFQSDATLKNSIKTQLETTLFQPTQIIEATNDDNAEITQVNVNGLSSAGELSLTLTSDGTYHQQHKKLRVDLIVSPPDYNFNVAMKTESINILKNDLTDQALAAKGNIIFEEGNAEIKGNINGYGGSIDFKNDRGRNTYGGINVGDGSHSVNVNISGDVSTRNAINFFSSDSTLSVGQSIYGNNINVAASSDRAQIHVNQDIFLYSDLYIGANDVVLTIADNNPDAENGDSRLTRNVNQYVPSKGNLVGLLSVHPVAKEAYTRTGSIMISENVNPPQITLNGLFLNGVIRYDLTEKHHFSSTGEEIAYKTGESFSTSHNKLYYQTMSYGSIYQSGVIATLEEFIVNTALNSDDPTNIAKLISFNDALDASLDQKEFRAIHYYTLGYEAYLERQKKEEPYLYSQISAVDKSIIRVRNPLRTPDTKAFYGINANGIVQFKNAETPDKDGKIYHPDIINTNALIYNQGTLSRRIDEKVNLLGFADYRNIHADIYGEQDLLRNWLDFSADEVGVADLNTTDVMLFNKDASKSVYVNDDTIHSGQINLPGQINTANELFKGTIVTAGDVYLYADDHMTFKGNIISGGDIHLLGAGTKEIIHDDLTIYAAINKNLALQKLYHTDTGRRLSMQGTMFNNDFYATIIANSDTIDINSVNDMQSNGSSVINAKGLRVINWVEE